MKVDLRASLRFGVFRVTREGHAKTSSTGYENGSVATLALFRCLFIIQWNPTIPRQYDHFILTQTNAESLNFLFKETPLTRPVFWPMGDLIKEVALYLNGHLCVRLLLPGIL